jgi:hypothetical protein
MLFKLIVFFIFLFSVEAMPTAASPCCRLSWDHFQSNMSRSSLKSYLHCIMSGDRFHSYIYMISSFFEADKHFCSVVIKYDQVKNIFRLSIPFAFSQPNSTFEWVDLVVIAQLIFASSFSHHL